MRRRVLLHIVCCVPIPICDEPLDGRTDVETLSLEELLWANDVDSACCALSRDQFLRIKSVLTMPFEADQRDLMSLRPIEAQQIDVIAPAMCSSAATSVPITQSGRSLSFTKWTKNLVKFDL